MSDHDVEIAKLNTRIKELEDWDDGTCCHDCNDTGWLENRVEGKYPCTCMTECEPYQLLETENTALNEQLVKATERELVLRKERDDYMQKAIALLTGLEANPALIDQSYEFLVKLGMAVAAQAKKCRE